MKNLKIVTITVFCLFMISIYTNHVFATSEPEGEIVTDTYYYIVNVNDNLRIEDILNDISLIAFDEYDGIITNKIEYDLNSDYILNVYDLYVEDRYLGEYEMEFSVSDSSGNRTTISIIIVVCDFDGPQFLQSSITSYTLNYDNYTLTEEQILSNIKVKDNHDKVSDLKLRITTNLDDIDPKLGIDYEVIVEAEDLSGNISEQIVVVNFEDTTAPVITGDSQIIHKSYKDKTSIDNILISNNISVIDNCDGYLDYYIIENHYLGNESIIGEYQVIIGASDLSGNEGTFSLTINIIDNIPPVFYIDKTKVFISSNNKINLDDFIKILSRTEEINNRNYQAFAILDEYSENYQTSGQYNYTLRLVYEDGDFQDYKFVVNVIESIIENIPEDSSFLQKVWYIIKTIGYVIWEILKWPIEKIRQLFNSLLNFI